VFPALIAAACDTGPAVDCNPTTATDVLVLAGLAFVVLVTLLGVYDRLSDRRRRRRSRRDAGDEEQEGESPLDRGPR